MDIRVTSTGKTFYRVDPTLAGILCEALPSVFEPVETKPARLACDAASQVIPFHEEPVWGLKFAVTCGEVSIQCDHLRGTEYFSGPPANAHEYFKRRGKAVPDHVVAEYAAKRGKERVPSAAASESETYKLQSDMARNNEAVTKLLTTVGSKPVYE